MDVRTLIKIRPSLGLVKESNMGLSTTGPALVIPVERIDKRRKGLSPEAIQVARELQETPGSLWESPAGAIPRSTAIGGAIGGGLGWTMGGIKPGDPNWGKIPGMGDPEYFKDMVEDVRKAEEKVREASRAHVVAPESEHIKGKRVAEEALEAVLKKLKREKARLRQGRLSWGLGAAGAAAGLGSGVYYQTKRHLLNKRLQEELGILGKPVEKISSEEKVAYTEKDLVDSINAFEAELVAGQVKIAKELTEGAREDLPDSAFALPGRKYPISDVAHAKNALARVSQFGTSAERETVRKKVYAKYPELKKNFEERKGESPTSEENVTKEKLGAMSTGMPATPKTKIPLPGKGMTIPKMPGPPKMPSPQQTPMPTVPQKPKMAWLIGGVDVGEEKEAQSIPKNIKTSPNTSPKEMAKILATQAAMKAKKK